MGEEYRPNSSQIAFRVCDLRKINSRDRR